MRLFNDGAGLGSEGSSIMSLYLKQANEGKVLLGLDCSKEP
jgi:hypothetical protein